MEKKYYATLEFKVSKRTIERAYENSPDPNADGTIDYYNSNMGKFTSVAGFSVNSYEEAEDFFKKSYKTIWYEEQTQIIIRRMSQLNKDVRIILEEDTNETN